MNPQWPIYIPSRGRYESRLTAKTFDSLKVPYLMVVEEDEYARYCEVIGKAKILVLDKAYQRDYVTGDIFGATITKGSGPARNFIWDHALSRNAPWHWVVDDNITGFVRLNRNLKIKVADGTIFRCMEDFCARYENVAMGGPSYRQFAKRKFKVPPFTLNTLIYGCILLRSDTGFRWRCRYNEDLDLSIRLMKAGWCTVLFRAFLQEKVMTMTMKGGNTDELYKDGTLKKSAMLAAQHPDVCELAFKFKRWHHRIDYARFAHLKLVRKAGAHRKRGVNNYGMTLEKVR